MGLPLNIPFPVPNLLFLFQYKEWDLEGGDSIYKKSPIM